MSVDEFSRYWRDVHGPIGRRIPGLRRLVQSHPIPDPDQIGPPTFDGMAELWFDDLAALRTARHSAKGKRPGNKQRNASHELLPPRCLRKNTKCDRSLAGST